MIGEENEVPPAPDQLSGGPEHGDPELLLGSEKQYT